MQDEGRLSWKYGNVMRKACLTMVIYDAGGV